MYKSLTINEPQVVFICLTNRSCTVVFFWPHLHIFLLGEQIKGFPLNIFRPENLENSCDAHAPQHGIFQWSPVLVGNPENVTHFTCISMRSLCYQKDKWLKWYEMCICD